MNNLQIVQHGGHFVVARPTVPGSLTAFEYLTSARWPAGFAFVSDPQAALWLSSPADARSHIASVAPRICGHCGDIAPVGQSCGCFDNGCQ